MAAGDRIGRFAVKQALSHTALVTTYLAEHAILGFPALLKLEMAPEAIAGESAALSVLHSPQVPQLYARGERDEAGNKQAYIVIEHLEGSTLAQTLRVRRRFEPNFAVRMVLQLLAALGEAHRQGLVHADIKPDNVLLTEPHHGADRFVLLGFGAVHGFVPPRSGVMTKVSSSPRYMAPELSSGAPPSCAADLFALGCILFEAISGEHPEWDADGRLVRQLAEIVPAHPDLSRVVAKAIAHDARVRFETAQDFATVLLALDVDELVLFGTAETTVLRGPAETVDTVDMTQPRADNALPESIRHRATAPGRPPLRSTGKPKVWLLSGDPGLDQPHVDVAVGKLLERYDVTVLDPAQREHPAHFADQDLPWVVVFGDLHTLVEEPILHDPRMHGETARVLVSTHQNVDMLSTSVNATGLDAQVCLDARVDVLVDVVDAMVERVRVTRIQYDGLRLAVADAHSDIEQLQQCFERKSA